MELLSIEHSSSFRLRGELDLSNVQELEEVLEAAQQHGGAVLLDLSELTFVDSTGIHAFVKAARRLRGRGCLILHGEHRRVRRVLDLLGTDSIPNLHRMDDGHESADDGDPEAWSGNPAGPAYAS